MKKITMLIVMALLCLNFPAGAQPSRVATGLQPGDVVPNVAIDHLINYQRPSADLYAFKRKLLILDFWATSCAPCIGQIAKLDSLQTGFGDQIKILSVTGERTQAILNFNKRYDATHPQKNRLPSVVEDKALRKLFPYHYIPHYVWIGQDGKVAGFTSAYYLTAENIRAFLTTGRLDSIPVKADVDLERPLFSSNSLPLNKLLTYKIFFKGRLEGTGASARVRQGEETMGICWTNETLAGLFNNCGSKLIANYSPKNMVVQAADSAALFYVNKRIAKADWYHDHVYSVDYIIPKVEPQIFYQDVLDFISSSSPYQAVIAPQNVKHLELRLGSSYSNDASSQAAYKNTLYAKPSGSLVNGPVNDFISWFNEKFPGWPILIDKTNATQPVTININQDLKSVAQLQSVLAAQGFQLITSDEPIDMLIIQPHSNAKP